jgi:predicted dehydrogenase
VAEVAVLGAGDWGARHVRCLLAARGVSRVHVVEPRPERREALAARFPAVALHAHAAAVLENPRVLGVVVATPAATHPTLARWCIEAGKHVLVEKPVATTLADAADLVARAERRRVALLPGHTPLFSGAAKVLRHHVRCGDAGALRWYASTRANLGRVRTDVDVLWDLAPHDAALLVDLFDPTVVACETTGVVLEGTGLDTCAVTMTTADGAGALFQLSWRWPEKVRRTTIVGSRAVVVWDDTDAVAPLRIHPLEIRREEDGERIAVRRGAVAVPAVDPTEPLFAECQHFVDVVNGLRAPALDGRHILKVTALLERAAAAFRARMAGGTEHPTRR